MPIVLKNNEPIVRVPPPSGRTQLGNPDFRANQKRKNDVQLMVSTRCQH